MDFVDRWNQLVALRQPRLQDIAAEPAAAYPEPTLFFEGGPNIMVEIARVARPRECPVLSVSLILEPEILASESLLRAVKLPPFAILGLTTPFSATDFQKHLVSRDVRGYTLSSQVDQLEAFVGPLSLAFLPEGQQIATDPDQSALVLIRFFYQVENGTNVDPTIERR